MADLSVLVGTPRIEGGKTQLLITFSFTSKLRQRRARKAGRNWKHQSFYLCWVFVNVNTQKNSRKMEKWMCIIITVDKILFYLWFFPVSKMVNLAFSVAIKMVSRIGNKRNTNDLFLRQPQLLIIISKIKHQQMAYHARKIYSEVCLWFLVLNSMF